MKIVQVAFEGFTDVDVHLPWDLLNRVRREDWRVRIVADRPVVRSQTGLALTVHGGLEEIADADAVLFASGPATRALCKDAAFLASLHLDPSRQLIGSMCSGALILAAKGLLEGIPATTYPTARKDLEAFGVTVLERPFVRHGNIATAAGCLAAQYLAGWVIETLLDARTRELVLRSVQPVGEGFGFDDADAIRSLYAPESLSR
ncbi:MAG TPA: DJ-1/PfpI family protein [Holophagaceae bacterium]|jgi:transcriptional regulator GlxA family with amidase domain|nr:DJ-1/PfpI family protein [Holophagaceae bacterium]